MLHRREWWPLLLRVNHNRSTLSLTQAMPTQREQIQPHKEHSTWSNNNGSPAETNTKVSLFQRILGSICESRPPQFWGSGSVSHKYGSTFGSRSFHHQAKIVRKTLIALVLWLLSDFLPLFQIRNRLRLRRIRMLWEVSDPHPDPLVRGTNPSEPKCHGSPAGFRPFKSRPKIRPA